jgi:bleomycin hydrolase
MYIFPPPTPVSLRRQTVYWIFTKVDSRVEQNRLALGALTTHAATAVLLSPSALVKDTHIFSDKIELEGSPVTNQERTGRCWLFASTNVFRVGMMKKYKLGSFQFSQSYLFFWDKLEKANFFLERE